MEETQNPSESAKVAGGVSDEQFQKIQGQMESPSVNEADFILPDQKGQEVAIKLLMKEELILIQGFLYHAFWTLEMNLEQAQKIHGIFCIDGSIPEVFSHFQGYFTAKQVKLETVDQLIYLNVNEKYGNKEIKFRIALKQGESNVQQTLQTVSGQVFALEEQNKQLKERVNQLEEELNKSKFLSQSKLVMDNEVDLIYQWVSRKGELPISSFNLLYRASAQGFKTQTFYKLCVKKGPLICFVQSQNFRRFGGFIDDKTEATQVGYVALNPNQSFVFSLDEKKQYLSNEENCLSAYYMQPTYGFTIGGGHDLTLSNDCNINSKSFSALGYSYGKLQGGTRETLAGSMYFQVNEIEVYQVIFNEQNKETKQETTTTV